jgi:hypothetical protein
MPSFRAGQLRSFTVEAGTAAGQGSDAPFAPGSGGPSLDDPLAPARGAARLDQAGAEGQPGQVGAAAAAGLVPDPV